MDNLKCCIVREFGYQSFYVEGLNIIIRPSQSLNINQRKIRNIQKVLAWIKRVGISRVTKALVPKSMVRKWFEIRQEDVIELLDYQGYEIKS